MLPQRQLGILEKQFVLERQQEELEESQHRHRSHLHCIDYRHNRTINGSPIVVLRRHLIENSRENREITRRDPAEPGENLLTLRIVI
jgi:hypothetical protein